MKQLIKTLVLVCTLMVVGSATASIVDDICPYVGVDYRQIWVKGRGIWSDRVHKSFPGGTLYLGAKFTENFGFEVGYNWTVNKHKSALISFNNPGVVLPSGFVAANSGLISTKVRFNSFYVDLNGYVPLQNCWELIGTIGAGSMKPKIGVTVINNGTLTPLQIVALQSANGKARAVWRVGVGAQYLFSENVGVRGLIRYEGTDGLRINTNNGQAFFIGDKAFKDAVTAQLGVFVRF